ncbi:fibrillin protein 5 homolog isoform X1 [Cryptomeria japonica]|uniref:fibrillin protein 5 homolog isoform X1 n=1 Tax=Cryptomeria japonica TaxID=3369 RepID=UPI0025ACFEFD|nr:fibrillin protein 5 homolog isoform X1 [Cryptomeria japonica]XP_057864136.1 fibrillin protein 5 homolog isoform X1 [Cryptomeria japonica]
MATVCFLTHTSIPVNTSKEKKNIRHSKCLHSALSYSFYRYPHKKIRSNNSVDNHGFVIATNVNQTRPINGISGTDIFKAAPEFGSVDELKVALKNSIQGLNRGIFGVEAKRKAEIEKLLKLLEGQNTVSNPTEKLEMVDGQWRLLYSTISILGSKRTKLGLRDFITLGEFIQTVDVEKGKAQNKICFSVTGLGMLRGELVIEASYTIASPQRVNIQFQKSTILPEKLLNLFKKNYDMLLSIFNPEGWLEITYLDNTTRIGRDDKGNLFLLERVVGEEV